MRNDGKTSEEIVRGVMLELEQNRRFSFHRFYDSRSAGLGSGGNFIPENPADYVVQGMKGSALLEIKSSINHDSLWKTTLRSVFSKHQILCARLWIRAGGRAVCIFHDVKGNTFEMWDMAYVAMAYNAPPRQRQLDVNGRIDATHSLNPLYQMMENHLC